jgi:hypothetical protein
MLLLTGKSRTFERLLITSLEHFVNGGEREFAVMLAQQLALNPART